MEKILRCFKNSLINGDINSLAGSCLNVLAGVRYVLIWKGGAVVNVLARVILTDVTYDAQTSSALLKQFYQIEWNYNSDLLSNVATISGYDAVINQVSYYSQENSGTKGNKFKEVKVRVNRKFNFNIIHTKKTKI